MLITLKADNPRAQIWYVTSPSASPGDALRYKKPIRITQSTPIYFFAYVDEQSESKIEKEEYIIVSSSGSSGTTASVSTKTGSITSGNTPANIAAALKKPIQKPIAVKSTPKPIALISTGKTLTGNTITPATGSGEIALASTGKTDSGITSMPPPKETIESLYKEKTSLEGSEIRKLLQDSKSSGFETMDTRAKTVAAAGLLSILVALGVMRFVRLKKGTLKK